MSNTKENTAEINKLVEVQSLATKISLNVVDGLAGGGLIDDIYETSEDGSTFDYTENGAYIQELIFDEVFAVLSKQQ